MGEAQRASICPQLPDCDGCALVRWAKPDRKKCQPNWSERSCEKKSDGDPWMTVWCKDFCGDVPSPEMEGKDTCASLPNLESMCSNDDWKKHNYCEQSCWDA